MTDILNQDLLILHAEFPRIGAAVELFWGHSELPEYITNLISDGRSNRQGFPDHIMKILLTLQELHDTIYPQYVKKIVDIWKL